MPIKICILPCTHTSSRRIMFLIQINCAPPPRGGLPQSLRTSALHQLSYYEPHWFVRYHYEISALIIVLHSTKQTISTEIACFVIFVLSFVVSDCYIKYRSHLRNLHRNSSVIYLTSFCLYHWRLIPLRSRDVCLCSAAA
jgi:hypothetical protein